MANAAKVNEQIQTEVVPLLQEYADRAKDSLTPDGLKQQLVALAAREIAARLKNRTESAWWVTVGEKKDPLSKDTGINVMLFEIKPRLTDAFKLRIGALIGAKSYGLSATMPVQVFKDKELGWAATVSVGVGAIRNFNDPRVRPALVATLGVRF